MVGLMVIMHCYMDRGRLCERNGAKNIVLCGLEVEIIIYMFSLPPGIKSTIVTPQISTVYGLDDLSTSMRCHLGPEAGIKH